MEIKPHFVPLNQKPEKLFKWKKVDCEIKGIDEEAHLSTYFSMKKVVAPETWSSLAVSIAASKYFRKVGVPGTGHETSILQLIQRVVNSITQSGVRQKGYFKTSQEASIFANELTYILLSQRAFFNSPVWFNCGIFEAYKIKGGSQNWAWDFKQKKVVLQKHSYLRPQVSACFIQGIEDSLESIFDLAKSEARLFKFGSGTGTNFSKLRSKHENIEGGGFSSGLISFLQVLDRGAGAIKSGGVTRRAAKMVIVDADHPEIVEFVRWKAIEEKKAKDLMAAGWGTGFESEAYHTVSGQNANNSVRVTNAFMKAVAQKKSWSLNSRVTSTINATVKKTVKKTIPKTIKKIKADDLWQEICQAAYECADPGLQFQDVISSWHMTPKSGEIRASNPCSEYMFLDDSACNLASLNLLKFLEEDGHFDLVSYLHVARVMFIAQDILVDLAGYPSLRIAKNSHDFRPLGLGFTGLGAFFMQKGLAYDSSAGRSWAETLTSLLCGQAFLTSAELARSKGSFVEYKKNRSSVLKVLARHQQAQQQATLKQAQDPGCHLPRDLTRKASDLWREALAHAAKYGLRNAQVTAMAPTGTIGLVMDCETTGIEPEFSLVKHKKFSGGGELRLVANSVYPALLRLGYNKEQAQEILDYIEVHEAIEGAPHLRDHHLTVFDCANKNGFIGVRHLSIEAHLQMMAAIQPFLSGAISKTVNLPMESTVEDVARVYRRAWELGLKSVAIYRDGSKGSQPLNRTQKIAGHEQGGPPCPECGLSTELVGGCYRCGNCGNTVGCS